MTAWTNEELAQIAGAEELQLSAAKRDGTLTSPVTIWVVRVGDELYVRSYRGREGSWYNSTLVRHQGRVRAGGVTKDVAFVEEADPDVNVRIDAEYRTKYRRHEPRHVDYMVEPGARETTLRLVPQAAASMG